ncbi:MAG: hypothetical protein M5U34_26695 [Chloroflexi bacterium]|nr:hypothetical protein [Chloroflexota bacterium]
MVGGSAVSVERTMSAPTLAATAVPITLPPTPNALTHSCASCYGFVDSLADDRAHRNGRSFPHALAHSHTG